MKKIFTLLFLSSVWISNAQTNFNPVDWAGSLTGYWDFENAANLGAAQTGTDLTIVGAGFTQVAGPNAGDHAAYKALAGNSMTCTTNIGANGGGTKTNQYSIMFDFMVPVVPAWNCFLNIDNTGDGELYLAGANFGGSAMFGGYTGPGVVVNQWYRAILTVDLNANPQRNLYIDGLLYMSGDVNHNTSALDAARVAMGTQFSFYGDSDSEQDQLYMSQAAVFNRALTDVEAITLGGTTSLSTAKFTASNSTLKVYPNPVSSNARISFNMPSSSKNANIELIDMTGRVVESIYRGNLEQGEQTISWDLKSKYNTGTYLVKLSSENTNQVYSILMK